MVGIGIYTNGDRSVEDSVFLFDADFLLPTVGVEINTVFFVQFRGKLFSMSLIRFSSLADFCHKIIVEEQLAGMSGLAVSEQHTVVERDIPGMNADVDVGTAAMVPAWHDGVEFCNAVLIRFLDTPEPSRVLDRVATLHELKGRIEVGAGPPRVLAHGISVPYVHEDAR